jgi:hypothetical protein
LIFATYLAISVGAITDQQPIQPAQRSVAEASKNNPHYSADRYEAGGLPKRQKGDNYAANHIHL